MAKIVWVLGAGFSAPLGGPLLARLLSPSSCRDLMRKYGGLFTDANWRWAAGLYHFGRSYQEGRYFATDGDGEPMWPDAETFIDQLDAEVHRLVDVSGDPHGRFQRLTPGQIIGERGVDRPPLKDVRDAARRLIAAECAMFVENGIVGSEQWSAHLAWFCELTADDTIVTFNYDRVLEVMKQHVIDEARRNGSPAPRTPRVMLPSETFDQSHADRPIVLKLHGSIDWQCKTDNTRETYVVAGERFALSAPGPELAIATPGPSKRAVSEKFKTLWELAGDRIAEADAIVFVGFRFPPTDAFARKALLDEIVQNTVPWLNLHVVLGIGPDADRDAKRLEELLKLAARKGKRTIVDGVSSWTDAKAASIHRHHLFSQDFLDLIHRAALAPPTRVMARCQRCGHVFTFAEGALPKSAGEYASQYRDTRCSCVTAVRAHGQVPVN